MKKILIILFLTSSFIFLGKTDIQAQCKQQMVYDCATQATNAIYLRDFNTKLRRVRSGETSGTKWTVVLNKGTRYRFNVCSPSEFEDMIVLTLYDSKHPEQTRPYAATKEGYSSFDFVCKKSGMYYVSIRFRKNQGKKKTCAVGILSFVGKNK